MEDCFRRSVEYQLAYASVPSFILGMSAVLLRTVEGVDSPASIQYCGSKSFDHVLIVSMMILADVRGKAYRDTQACHECKVEANYKVCESSSFDHRRIE